VVEMLRRKAAQHDISKKNIKFLLH